jgi:hypothetical protein
MSKEVERSALTASDSRPFITVPVARSAHAGTRNQPGCTRIESAEHTRSTRDPVGSFASLWDTIGLATLELDEVQDNRIDLDQ